MQHGRNAFRGRRNDPTVCAEPARLVEHLGGYRREPQAAHRHGRCQLFRADDIRCQRHSLRAASGGALELAAAAEHCKYAKKLDHARAARHPMKLV